jgi:hypothetical protein
MSDNKKEIEKPGQSIEAKELELDEQPKPTRYFIQWFFYFWKPIFCVFRILRCMLCFLTLELQFKKLLTLR